MNNFRVGQKVVCVETWLPEYPRYGYGDEVGPVKGAIYTIREIGYLHDRLKGHISVRLVEIVNRIGVYRDNPDGWEQCFRVSRFRPVKTTSIEIFRAMLVTPPKVRTPA